MNKTKAHDFSIELEPGEKILRQTAVTTETIMRNLTVSTVVFAAVMVVIQLIGGAPSWTGALVPVLFFAAVTGLFSYFFELGQKWLLTNRRLIGSRGQSIPLSLDLRVREYFWGIVVSQSMLKSVRLRSIADKSAFAAAIRSAMRSSVIGEDEE